MSFIRHHPQGVLFKVFVQPRSSKNQISGIHGDALKIKLTAPPVNGAANALCVTYLAKCLNVPKSSLEIISGHAGRIKKILYRPKTSSYEKDLNTFKHRIHSLLNNKQTT
ncbi:MAG: DUF167 domain-containing protein [Deltaproteobacteria bacterium]|nr:MAG: DUF167 domain-containing protein [Deltaproteobacteria bacterium]